MDKRILSQSLGVTTVVHTDGDELIIEEKSDASDALRMMSELRNSNAVVEKEGIGKLVGSVDMVTWQGWCKSYPELHNLNTPEGQHRLSVLLRENWKFAASDRVKHRGI